MKDWMPESMRRRTLSSIIIVAAGAAIALLVFRFDAVMGTFQTLFSVFEPVLIGFVIAYLLASPLKRIERRLEKLVCKKKRHPALLRALSLTAVYIVTLAVVGVFIWRVAPELVRSVFSLFDVLPSYARYLGKEATRILSQYNIDEQKLVDLFGTGENMLASAIEYLKPMLSNVLALSAGITGAVSNTFLGLVVSVYMLASKEKFVSQIKKLGYSIFSKPHMDSIVRWSREGHRTFGGFIGGKILDSAIVGFISYLFMLATGMRYALLISVIMGVTNLVPFFGPIVGGVACSLLMLIVDPRNVVWFALYAVVIQQIDGNLMGPAILGDSIGLSPFWVMVSILVGGGLFGFLGMLLSIPVFAMIYAITRSMANARLAERGMPVESAAYYDMPPLETDSEKAAASRPSQIARLIAFVKRGRKKP